MGELTLHEVTVRYGKIGTDGQTLSKPFDDAASAAKHAEKLVSEKLKGGYVEVGASQAPAPAKQATPPTQAPKATKPVSMVSAPDGGAF